MTATDELRKLLDEQGVEWGSYDEFEPRTQWEAHDGAFVYWARERNGMLLVETTAPEKCSLSMTPEQAIAATLGAGVCRNAAPNYLDFLCSECGFVHYHSDENDSGDGNEWNYCPNCGRRIEVTA